MRETELLIVGAGAAGLAAASAAHKAGAKDIILVDRANEPGGILPQCIHRGFGLITFGRELTGPEYVEQLLRNDALQGVELRLNTNVLSIRPDRRALLAGPNGTDELRFRQLLLATGCREISFSTLTVSGTRPAGIFTAGQVQELVNLRHRLPGREALILGSGDLGMLMARRLTLAGAHVIAVVEKEERFGGMARNYHRCIEQFGIPLLTHTEVTEVFGEGRICAVTLRNTDTDCEETVDCDTLVTALGLIPEQSLADTSGRQDWLHFCGNANRVHDIIDSAVEDARRTVATVLALGK